MSQDLLRKATEMRNAIDMIEGALMGLGDFVDLPDLFESTAEYVNLAPRMTVGEMRRVCTALAECTRIINSDEFAPDELRRHAGDAADLQQTFDLQWEADMRAVRRWREAHPGNDLVLPDRANMVVWLMEQHDALAVAPADEEARDNLRLIDYIADRIGLPQTDELSRENFDAWMSAKREIIEQCKTGV